MMVAKRFACVALAQIVIAGTVMADDIDPYQGAFSVLEASAEAKYGMSKFACLTTFTIQQRDGSYVAYSIDTKAAESGMVVFRPFEIGSCTYTAATKMERCKVSKSSWGLPEAFVEHGAEVNGVHHLRQVFLSNPSVLYEFNAYRCAFDEQRITGALSDKFLEFSSADEMYAAMYRWLPSHPRFARKIAKALGITSQ